MMRSNVHDGFLGTLRRFGTLITVVSMITAPSVADATKTERFNSKSWRFEVSLDGKPIGFHEFILEHSDGHEKIDIHADFDVRFLRIPVYSYEHWNTETWSDGCLKQLKSKTNDNGDIETVQANFENGFSTIITTKANTVIESGCVMSFAYWNPDFLSRDSLLNAQTGQLVEVKIQSIKAELPAHFSPDEVEQYRITTDDQSVHIEVGYLKKTREWLYLESKLENGRVLRYLPGTDIAEVEEGINPSPAALSGERS